MSKILIFTLLFLTVACDRNQEAPNASLPTQSSIPEPTVPPAIGTDYKKEKHSVWVIENDFEKITVESVGWCKNAEGQKTCDYHDLTLVVQGDKKFIAKRSLPGVANFGADRTEKADIAFFQTVIDGDSDDFSEEIGGFEEAKKNLGEEKVEIAITDKISFRKYRMGVAAQHHYDNSRCQKSEVAKQFASTCPLAMGNINLVNNSADILAGLSEDIHLAIEVSVSGEVQSIATYFLNRPSIVIGSPQKGWIEAQPSFQLIPTVNTDHIGALKPFYATLEGAYRELCSQEYDSALFGLSLRGPTLPYRPQIRPDLEEEVSQKAAENFTATFDDVYYDTKFWEFGHIFYPAFWDGFLPSTPKEFIKNENHLGGACESFFIN